jgi:hypothetical protein
MTDERRRQIDDKLRELYNSPTSTMKEINDLLQELAYDDLSGKWERSGFPPLSVDPEPVDVSELEKRI